ncbi:hypothetical protein AcV7_001132 [Taiwanofungus camphoratus]|nr:hypothetical protein AcV7_001132 [Antrodia cinnamomea]
MSEQISQKRTSIDSSRGKIFPVAKMYSLSFLSMANNCTFPSDSLTSMRSTRLTCVRSTAWTRTEIILGCQCRYAHLAALLHLFWDRNDPNGFAEALPRPEITDVCPVCAVELQHKSVLSSLYALLLLLSLLSHSSFLFLSFLFSFSSIFLSPFLFLLWVLSSVQPNWMHIRRHSSITGAEGS